MLTLERCIVNKLDYQYRHGQNEVTSGSFHGSCIKPKQTASTVVVQHAHNH